MFKLCSLFFITTVMLALNDAAPTNEKSSNVEEDVTVVQGPRRCTRGRAAFCVAASLCGAGIATITTLAVIEGTRYSNVLKDLDSTSCSALLDVEPNMFQSSYEIRHHQEGGLFRKQKDIWIMEDENQKERIKFEKGSSDAAFQIYVKAPTTEHWGSPKAELETSDFYGEHPEYLTQYQCELPHSGDEFLLRFSEDTEQAQLMIGDSEVIHADEDTVDRQRQHEDTLTFPAISTTTHDLKIGVLKFLRPRAATFRVCLATTSDVTSDEEMDNAIAGGGVSIAFNNLLSLDRPDGSTSDDERRYFR